MNLLNKLYMVLLNQLGWTAEMSVTGIADIDAAIPEFWADGILHDGNRESFWGQLSGKERSFMPVIDKTGQLRSKGDQISFNTIAQLMGTGVSGESVLKGNEESLSIGTFTVGVDMERHAVAVTKKSTKQANFEEVQTAKTLLKEWATRKMDNDVFTTILDNADDVLYANGKTGEDLLNEDAGDIFGVQEIEMIRMALIRKGALPIQTKKVNGRTIPLYGIVYGEIEEFNLNQNTTFVQSVREALKRFTGEGSHPIFNSAIGIYRGCLLYPYYSALPIPQGTPLRPETTIYATLTTTATVLSVGGATATTGVTPNYTLFFASAGSLQIADEVISYSSKSVNSFIGLTRAALEFEGSSATTAIQHSNDALVTQRNIASVIGFGAEAVCRAIGETPEPIGESDDYGEQIGLGIRSYYGQSVTKDKRRNKSNNVVVLKCISDNPGTV